MMHFFTLDDASKRIMYNEFGRYINGITSESTQVAPAAVAEAAPVTGGPTATPRRQKSPAPWEHHIIGRTNRARQHCVARVNPLNLNNPDARLDMSILSAAVAALGRAEREGHAADEAGPHLCTIIDSTRDPRDILQSIKECYPKSRDEEESRMASEPPRTLAVNPRRLVRVSNLTTSSSSSTLSTSLRSVIPAPLPTLSDIPEEDQKEDSEERGVKRPKPDQDESQEDKPNKDGQA